MINAVPKQKSSCASKDWMVNSILGSQKRFCTEETLKRTWNISSYETGKEGQVCVLQAKGAKFQG